MAWFVFVSQIIYDDEASQMAAYAAILLVPCAKKRKQREKRLRTAGLVARAFYYFCFIGTFIISRASIFLFSAIC